MSHQIKGYCAYNYCEGNHQRINNIIMKDNKTQNAYYLKIALNNSKNKRIVQEKLLKCQEKVQITKNKRQYLNEHMNTLPKLNEIDKHAEDQCRSNGTNSEFVSVSTELLIEMFQMQIEIDNILRKFS